MNNVSLINLAMLIPFGIFLLLLLLQYLCPQRDLRDSGISRIIHNLFLFVANTLILRLLIPLTLVACAEWARKEQIGVFNIFQIRPWASVLICLIAMDLAIYWQHVATHRFAWLWRLHKVHHSDHDMDVTTAVRFHPLELILSLVYKSTLVVLLGAPLVAVVLFELLLFASPAFNHSNLRLPAWLDSKLRWGLVTPDMHRIHHSVEVAEHNTNFGFFLVWWDRLFASYTDQPAIAHTDMIIGLSKDDCDCKRVDQMLLAPFR